MTTAQDVLERFVQLPADEKKKVISVILRESLDAEANELTGEDSTLNREANFSEIDKDENWRVQNSRVSKYSVIYAFNQGASAEEIALRFPTLDLKQIYSVINSYLQNPNESDDYFAGQSEQQEEQKRQIENRFSPEGIRQKLLERSQNKK